MQISNAKRFKSICTARKFLPKAKREQYVIEQTLLSNNLESTSTIKNWYSGKRVMLPSSVNKLELQYAGISEYYNEAIFELLMSKALTKNQILKIGWKQFHAFFNKQDGTIKEIEFRPFYAVPDDSFNSFTVNNFTSLLIELRLGLAYRYEVPLEEIYHRCLITFLFVSLHQDFYHSRSLMFSSLMEIMRQNRHELAKLNITKDILIINDNEDTRQVFQKIESENTKEKLHNEFMSSFMKTAKMLVAKSDYTKSQANQAK